MATVLGKIMSMLRSYGDILRIMSRASQHVLGVQTLQFGWSVCFPVTVHIFTELLFIRDILDSHNGQPIFTAATHAHTIELQQIADLVSKIEHSVVPWRTYLYPMLPPRMLLFTMPTGVFIT